MPAPIPEADPPDRQQLERFGFTNPVLISDDGETVAGHGRVEAAKLLGLEKVPALRLSHPSAAERGAYVIADNKLALNAGWDSELLAIELQGLIDLDLDLEVTGFSLAEIDLVLDEAGETSPERGGEKTRPTGFRPPPCGCTSRRWRRSESRSSCR